MFALLKRKVIAWGQRTRVRFPFLTIHSWKVAYRFAQLVEIVRILRGPEGCPWDQKQQLENFLPYLKEESIEALLAGHQALQGGLEEKDAFSEELGDLLFVMAFLMRLGEEEGSFSAADSLGHIVAKMLRRHPHVFAEAPRDKASIKQNWQRIKAEERRLAQEKKAARAANGHVSTSPAAEDDTDEAFVSILASSISSMSALHDALDISRRVVKVGFEWPDVWGVWAKMHEEIEELREVMPDAESAAQYDAPSEARGALQQRQQDELGDLLFTLVNLGRHLGIDAEEALRGTCVRFMRRFQYIERALHRRGQSLQNTPLEEMETLWQEAKRHQGAT